jgi:branched-chain amino acid transport system ATP-binding protein
MTPLLEVEGLTKHFGGLTAVNNVSFRIEKGEMVGLIGPNGSGKTTLLRLISGILKPSAGRVKLRGKNITGRPIHYIVNEGVAVTFQMVKPFPRLPAVTNVLTSCISPRANRRGEWIKTAEARALEAMEFTGIADLALERASTLSHGDLKRLEIARAIGTDPDLLLLDEPFGGLNPAEVELLAGSLGRLHKGGRFGRLHSEGPDMLIVEHKLAELMRMVDRVIVLNLGEIIAEGTPQVVANNEKVIEAYMGGESY